MALHMYHRKLSVCGVSGTRCTAPWIVFLWTIEVVPMPKRGLQQLLPSCKGCIEAWCLSLTITIPAAWRIGPVANIWTEARSPFTLDSASSTTKRHCHRVWMHLAVDLKWRSGLVPIARSTITCFGGLCFLHLVDPAQRTIWSAYSWHWKDVTGITPALYRMYCQCLRQLQYWLWSM